MPAICSAVPKAPPKCASPAVGQPSLHYLAEQNWLIGCLLLVLCSLLFFYGLCSGELYRTESLRALVAAEFLRSGNWVVPVLYGQPLLTKPPGMYAAIALASWPAGTVCEWTARLPSALAATLMVFLFYGHFRRELGRLGGLIAALVLPTSLLWLTYAPSAEIDMLQVTWVTVAILCFLRALDITEAQAAANRLSVSAAGYRVSATGQILEHRAFGPPTDARERHSAWFWWLAALLCVTGGFLTKWTAPAFFYGTVVPLLWWRGQSRLLVQRQHLVSATLAGSLCLAWITTAGALAGWSVLAETVSREALLRLLPTEQQPHSWLKLLLHPILLLAANLPWSAVAVLALRPGFAQLWDARGRRLLQALHCWIWPNLIFWSVIPERALRHSFPLFPGLAGLAALVWLAWLTGRLRWPVPRVSPLLVFVSTLVLWLVVKLGFVHLVVPLRNEQRQPRAKGEQLATCVPEGKTLYLFGLKDRNEGILFYYGRPVRRLAHPALLPASEGAAYALLDELEWRTNYWAEDTEVLLRLHDEVRAPIVLVKFSRELPEPAPESP